MRYALKFKLEAVRLVKAGQLAVAAEVGRNPGLVGDVRALVAGLVGESAAWRMPMPIVSFVKRPLAAGLLVMSPSQSLMPLTCRVSPVCALAAGAGAGAGGGRRRGGV